MISQERIIFDNDIKKEYKVKLISGSDEAGRGAMAGPVVVASVILNPTYENPLINDSKKISSILREKLFIEIIKNSVSYDIKIYDSKFVDKYNPKKTSKIGMVESIKDLAVKPDLCLLDAEKIEIDIPTLALMKGDSKSQAIAAASILAKVTRDRIMIELGKKHPQYGLEINKGYCTKKHIENLEKYGVLDFYRQTYKPVKKIMEEK